MAVEELKATLMALEFALFKENRFSFTHGGNYNFPQEFPTKCEDQTIGHIFQSTFKVFYDIEGIVVNIR